MTTDELLDYYKSSDQELSDQDPSRTPLAEDDIEGLPPGDQGTGDPDHRRRLLLHEPGPHPGTGAQGSGQCPAVEVQPDRDALRSARRCRARLSAGLRDHGVGAFGRDRGSHHRGFRRRASTPDRSRQDAGVRGERTAKYNRLLQIEEELGSQARYAGMDFRAAF